MKRSFTSERGAALCIKSCLDQIEAGRELTLASDDLEGPHELRIGLRRLRTALGLFRRAIDGPQTRALAEQAKWLGQEVGKTRDLEVVLCEIFEPALGADSGDPGRHPFLQALHATRDQERSRLKKLLAGNRVRAFMAQLRDYVAHRGWLLADDIAQTERLAKPLGRFADTALRGRWKNSMRKAEDLEHLSVEQSHELRKELKKLRYSVEFLAPLYPARRLSPFLKRLKAMQTVYGDWNDAAIARRVFEAMLGQDMAELGDLGRVADVMEKLHTRAAEKIAAAGKLWGKLQSSDRPWA